MNKLLELALNRINTGVLIIDKEQKILLWNSWLENLSGKKAEHVLGCSLTQLYPLFNNKVYQQYLQSALSHGQSMFCSGAFHSLFIPPKDSSLEVKQNLQIEPLILDDESYVMMQIFDITTQHKRVHLLKSTIKELETAQRELEAMERIIRHQAYHDSLTCLPNRLMFREQLTKAIEDARKASDRIAVVFLDLDDFKKVNDSFGHLAGDELLQAIAARLQALLQPTDFLARIGGDEFILFFPGVDSETHILSITEKINQVVLEPINIAGHLVRISVSVGVAFFPDDGLDVDTLLKKSDSAMYSAKENCKGSCIIFGHLDS